MTTRKPVEKNTQYYKKLIRGIHCDGYHSWLDQVSTIIVRTETLKQVYQVQDIAQVESMKLFMEDGDGVQHFLINRIAALCFEKRLTFPEKERGFGEKRRKNAK